MKIVKNEIQIYNVFLQNILVKQLSCLLNVQVTASLICCHKEKLQK